MEQFPFESEKKEKTSKVTHVVRATVAGAALLGASQLIELPKSVGESLPSHSALENHESFSEERETQAFLETIAALEDKVIQDSRGRRKLMTVIDEKLNVLALALEQRTPHFSAIESTTLTGVVTNHMRRKAEQLLITTVDIDSNNFAVQTLALILSNAPLISPERQKELGDW